MPFSRLMHQWHIHVVGSPLVFESTLLLYPLRAIVTVVIANPDFHHPTILKCMANHLLCGLCHQPLSPIRHTQPISKFAFIVAFSQVRCIPCFQTYTADGLSRFLQNYGIRLWVSSNPQPPSKNEIELKEKEATQKKRLKEVKIATRRHKIPLPHNAT